MLEKNEKQVLRCLILRKGARKSVCLRWTRLFLLSARILHAFSATTYAATENSIERMPEAPDRVRPSHQPGNRGALRGVRQPLQGSGEKKGTVTVRDRDTGAQERIHKDRCQDYLRDRLKM